MKKGLSLLMANIFAGVVYAQNYSQNSFPGVYRDTTIVPYNFSNPYSPDSLKMLLQLRKYLADGPAGSMRKGFRYLGPNGKGFEVYQTLHDHMYILKPDSSFVSNMPVIVLPPTVERRN